MQFLLFTLYAPMAAMGDIAPGERRMGFARPARSAILGLVAAALGYERDDPRHAELEDGLNFAVRTDVPGRPFTDYHTAQTPQQRKNAVFATRREELQAEDLNTVLSVREWRSDCLYTIALWPRAAAAMSLEGISDALRRPQFTLYFGRKAGPVALPLSPRLVTAEKLVEALAQDTLEGDRRKIVAYIEDLARSRARRYCVELAFDVHEGITPDPIRIETRRDGVANRGRHQFRERAEGICEVGT